MSASMSGGGLAALVDADLPPHHSLPPNGACSTGRSTGLWRRHCLLLVVVLGGLGIAFDSALYVRTVVRAAAAGAVAAPLSWWARLVEGALWMPSVSGSRICCWNSPPEKYGHGDFFRLSTPAVPPARRARYRAGGAPARSLVSVRELHWVASLSTACPGVSAQGSP
jgi:hypothetical protein